MDEVTSGKWKVTSWVATESTDGLMREIPTVMPAKAGIHAVMDEEPAVSVAALLGAWLPAFAAMTMESHIAGADVPFWTRVCHGTTRKTRMGWYMSFHSVVPAQAGIHAAVSAEAGWITGCGIRRVPSCLPCS